jgi:hypothetical protein
MAGIQHNRLPSRFWEHCWETRWFNIGWEAASTGCGVVVSSPGFAVCFVGYFLGSGFWKKMKKRLDTRRVLHKKHETYNRQLKVWNMLVAA